MAMNHNSHSPRKNNSVHFTDLLVITIQYHFKTVGLSLISNPRHPGDTMLPFNNSGSHGSDFQHDWERTREFEKHGGEKRGESEDVPLRDTPRSNLFGIYQCSKNT